LAHACNPNYSGGREQKDPSLNNLAAGQKFRETLSRKKSITKKAGGVVQGIGPEFKPHYCKTNKQTEHIFFLRLGENRKIL
jgi:hypothetical protein